MAGLTCRVLGPLELAFGGTPIKLDGRKTRALFAILLIERGRVVSTGHLIDELWSDAPPDSARHLIHVYVSNIRNALKRGGVGDILATRAPGYALMLKDDAVD